MSTEIPHQKGGSQVIDVVWDMETQDPDDFLTLLLLCGHPGVNLKAVTIMPGSVHQVGLVRQTLAQFGLNIPVGAFKRDHPKRCISPWHDRAFGRAEPSNDAEEGGRLLVDICDERTTLITGAPPKNLGRAMQDPSFTLGRWVAQGGFAGEGLVPRHLQLEKFRGRLTCPSFNLNGAPKEVLKALTFPGIEQRFFVAKNVCHGVVYDPLLHGEVQRHMQGKLHLQKIWKGMDVYLGHDRHVPHDNEISSEQVRLIDHKGHDLGAVPLVKAIELAQQQNMHVVQKGRLSALIPTCKIEALPPTAAKEKKLHDPLAACCAIQPEIAVWEEVEIYRSKGEWGARQATGTNTHIIIDYDRDLFKKVLLQ